MIRHAIEARVSDCFEMWEDERTHYRSLHASAYLASGQQLCSFTSEGVLPAPNRFSVQVDELHHIMLQPQYLSYINHSCDPNVYFDTVEMRIVALREIGPTEEITFFYPSTEWRMSQPFQCLCKSAKCLKYIRGAAFLPMGVISAYRLSDHIQRLLVQQWFQKIPLRACHPQNMLLERAKAGWLAAAVAVG